MINWYRTLLVIFSGAICTLPAVSQPANTAAPSVDPANPAPAASSKTYVSVKGDSFTSLSNRFGCTIHEIKKLNGLKTTRLKVGTTLLIPVSKTVAARGKKKAALASAPAKKLHHHAPLAQPVQDFDLPASTYASCPTPPSNGAAAADFPESEENGPPLTPAPPVAEPIRLPLAANHTSLLPLPNVLPAAPVASRPRGPLAATLPASMPPSAPAATNPLLPPTEPKKSFANALADFFGGNSHGLSTSESGEWGNRFLTETRNLAGQGICYDGSWRPDGESHRWEMDCSNTTRYLYQVTAGIALPRTASDQYYYLHLQDKAWDVPMTPAGFADTHFLRENLKPGDLLFWENTYRPDRQPPITHVMIYLGTDAAGRWLMAGSQGSKGFYNRRHSGPDVYVFNPTRAVGGYTTWLGLVHHHGRFVAYGRPLEADVKKLSVAAND